MKENKFRAWKKDEKSLYFFDLYGLYCIDPNRMNYPKGTTGYDFNINDAPFDRYIGLNDVEENEIYENDVVSTTINKEQKIFFVWWNDYYCSFWLKDNNGILFDGQVTQELIRDTKLSIIGNIHENPELLNK